MSEGARERALATIGELARESERPLEPGMLSDAGLDSLAVAELAAAVERAPGRGGHGAPAHGDRERPCGVDRLDTVTGSVGPLGDRLLALRRKTYACYAPRAMSHARMKATLLL